LAAGALAGGWLADRMNRRFAYLLSGAIAALVAILMLVRPATPTWFTIGCLAYMFMNGVAFAAFYAFVYDMVGHKSGVGTKLALFIGISNFPISYVTWLDSHAYDAAKAAGLPGRYGALGMDAVCTIAGVALLASVTYFARRSKPVLAAAASESSPAT
jgi:nitrate/nitrite transporter NarK